MSFNDVVIRAHNLGKLYYIYRRPIDRLIQMLTRGKIKYADEYWAVRGVSFEIRRGEMIGIIGRNGSGKSTLLQLLYGTLASSEGTVEVKGRVAALIELGAGFNPEFTGEENIRLAASVLGLSEIQIKERFQAIVDFAGIGDFLRQPVKLYSSGMYARLAFAVAANVDADILIIDEILSVGDAAFTQKCMRFIRKFKEHGTILFVSHDASSVVSLCDRCIWLESGQLREVGPSKEVCEHYTAAIQSEAESPERFNIGGSRKTPPKALPMYDVRKEDLRSSNLRNVIKVFDFDPDAQWYGRKAAEISHVSLLDEDGQRSPTIDGGDKVVLRITAKAHRQLSGVILGFYVKDRLGQRIFGDNTYISYRDTPLNVGENTEVEAAFSFVMPYLVPGDYSVSPAIAEGDQENHVQHHWIEDALFFKVITSHAEKGLMGVPMLDISINSSKT